MSTKTALVMRATGVQGKGTIKNLLGAGWNVHALVTDASSDRALALKSLGDVILFQGTWKDPQSIKAAVAGCQALLLNQMPSFTDDSEVQEARLILDLGTEAGVQHVVFPTTLPLNNPNVRDEMKGSVAAPAVLNKGDVEELVKSSGLKWTLLRPGYFMTNLLPPLVYWMYPEFKDRKFVNSYGPDCILTLVDPDDIGAFVLAALENPTKYAGQVVTVVGENKRVDDILKELEEASGLPIEAVYRTKEETEKLKDNPFVAGHLLAVNLHKYVDLEEVKSYGVPLTSLKAFLEKHKDELVPSATESEDAQSGVFKYLKDVSTLGEK
ncbi:NAD(P)-binding protein [Pyrenochaeta sp. DS3sAY3a]|nr:NAD(P)-binding protein [Pyrenochaeta sp. DS3sAY3a]